MKDDNNCVIADILPRDLNNLVKTIMKQTGINNPREAVRKAISNEVSISIIAPKWFEENNIIYFSLFLDKISRKQWFSSLEITEKKISDSDKKLLKSLRARKPTIYHIAVIKGGLFRDNERNNKNINDHASKMKLSIPPPEISLLMREELSNEDLKAMGLDWIITMHKPIKDADNKSLRLLGINQNGSWLRSYSGDSENEWNRGGGFAFVLSSEPQFKNY